MSSRHLYPSSPRQVLAELYLGQSLGDVPTPAAVINVAAVRRNCERMLQTCDRLGLGWRAHVKTHKTVEITQLQVGKDASRPVKLIVSTLAEAEFLLPMLRDHRDQGRKVNVLYGLPISQNAISRLAGVAQTLGEDSVSVLLDDPAQVAIISNLHALSGVLPHAHIKIDMGGRRAGLQVESDRFLALADAALEAHIQGKIILSGLYSHAGHSYGGDGRVAAVRMMRAEMTALLLGADRLKSRASDKAAANLPALVVSAGASPTSMSVQNLISAAAANDEEYEKEEEAIQNELNLEVKSLAELFASVREKGHAIEIHAGVYPILDLQQLAAHSISVSRLSWRDMALTVLAEVHSNYPGRGVHGSDEALVGAGGLALARETCKAYEGMAMLTPWNRQGIAQPACDVEDFRGWIIGRVSQEHGILTWRSGNAQAKFTLPDEETPRIGDKVRLWPNHACITGSQFGWYFVVDEDRAGKEDEIVDIWIRGRGW
ncbi:hypothetical protein E4U42_006019 [Claviceps africana]|uniref:D-serine dehydratase-like domain-containing protein n=1 Tax=Claviceps africana TaxID=83212 RepID=A0A8K0J3H5_9HYPO|nr:hypothetical protein E4U42_006019 [Claviceps africana]